MTTEKLKATCSDKLKRISSSVLADDRKDAMEEFGVGYMTIHRYVNGDVRNLQLGLQLYEFLKKRISDRKRVLA